MFAMFLYVDLLLTYTNGIESSVLIKNKSVAYFHGKFQHVLLRMHSGQTQRLLVEMGIVDKSNPLLG